MFPLYPLEFKISRAVAEQVAISVDEKLGSDWARQRLGKARARVIIKFLIKTPSCERTLITKQDVSHMVYLSL